MLDDDGKRLTMSRYYGGIWNGKSFFFWSSAFFSCCACVLVIATWRKIWRELVHDVVCTYNNSLPPSRGYSYST